LWIAGESGVFKSELATLAQAHYDTFTRTSLPGSFAATANALERLLFAAKDALVVVDDYYPATSVNEANHLSQFMSRLLRGVGNRKGRQRMNADTQLRPELPPRCLPMVTAERNPEGHSNSVRAFAIPIGKGDVDSAKRPHRKEAQSVIEGMR
jgi:hypothetical protein